MYEWRKLSQSEREELLQSRKSKRRPWHSPPHRRESGVRQFIISAACYEHAPIIGSCPKRMESFADLLLSAVEPLSERLFAWCLLPNHYHVVVQTEASASLLHALGQLHGRTSYQWNGEDDQRGRAVWFGVSDREMRSESHLWASINYVHHNPVKHGYVSRWQDWPWSSASPFLDEVGADRAKELWRMYPVNKYGQNWDD